MKSVMSNLNPLKTALLTVSENVGLFEAIDATKTHIVYAPDSEGERLNLNNIKDAQVIQGTVDLYSLKKDVSMVDAIQIALNDAGISFYLNSVQFEALDKNDFIHYEWVFEVS